MPRRPRKTEGKTSISVEVSLVKIIDEVVASGKHGYANRPDFVRDAIRRRLRELGFIQ